MYYSYENPFPVCWHYAWVIPENLPSCFIVKDRYWIILHVLNMYDYYAKAYVWMTYVNTSVGTSNINVFFSWGYNLDNQICLRHHSSAAS